MALDGTQTQNKHEKFVLIQMAYALVRNIAGNVTCLLLKCGEPRIWCSLALYPLLRLIER
jgi:hypothetical protein